MCVNDIYASKPRFHKTYHYKASRPEETSVDILHRDLNANKLNGKQCIDVTEEKIPGIGQEIYFCTIPDPYDRFPARAKGTWYVTINVESKPLY